MGSLSASGSSVTRREQVLRKLAFAAMLVLLTGAAAILVLTACEADYREAGRQAGQVFNEAGTRAVLDSTAGADRRATDAARARRAASTVAAEAADVGGTVAAKVGEHAPTVAAEVGERAPTVAVEAAEAAREFSEGVQESGACNGAAIVFVCGILIVAVVPRPRN
jgi:hypothetical protein